jgi:hypothetical protein
MRLRTRVKILEIKVKSLQSTYFKILEKLQELKKDEKTEIETKQIKKKSK